MQPGIIFLLCASIPFPFLSGSSEGDGSPLTLATFDSDDFEFINTDDIPDMGDADFDYSTFTLPVEEASVTRAGQGKAMASLYVEDFVPRCNLFTSGLSAATSASRTTEVAAEVDQVINANVSTEGRYGLTNHRSICYMSAFITASFNIHRFREAVYAGEPETASAFMLAQVFAKMQNAKAPIQTVRDLMPAVQKDLNWVFGQFQCNLEFSSRFLDTLPPSVKELFALKVRDNFYRLDNGILLGSTVVPGDSYQIVHPGSQSVAEAIYNKFPFANQVSYLIEEENHHEYVDTVPEFDGTKILIPARRESEIINRPEIMMIGIPRTQGNEEVFKSDFTELGFELLMPPLKKERVEGEEHNDDGLEDEYEAPVQYLLGGFCHYVHFHYISYVRDFSRGNPEGDWYSYNDQTVTPVRTKKEFESLLKAANTAATLAFYIRADSVRREEIEIPIPTRFLRLAKLQLAIEEVLDLKTQMKSGQPRPHVKSSAFSSIKTAEPRSQIEENLPPKIHSDFFNLFPLNGEYLDISDDFFDPVADSF